MKYLIFSALSVLLFVSGEVLSQTYSTDGYICDNCVDYASARQQAELYAPELDCGDPFIPPDDPLECISTPRRVILGHLSTLQIYSFKVTRESVSPFVVTVEDINLPAQLYDNYVTAMQFLNGINAGFEEIDERWNPVTGSFDQVEQ